MRRAAKLSTCFKICSCDSAETFPIPCGKLALHSHVVLMFPRVLAPIHTPTALPLH